MRYKSSIDSSAVVYTLFTLDRGSDKSEGIEDKQKENKCYSCIRKRSMLYWVEIVCLFSFCALVAGGFTVPIIIYMKQGSDLGNTTTSEADFDLDFDSCSNSSTTQVCKQKV